MKRIVMPLLLQNRSNRAYRPVPKPGPELRVAPKRVGEENQQEKGISAISPSLSWVLLLAVTVAAVIARAQKRAALSTAVRA